MIRYLLLVLAAACSAEKPTPTPAPAPAPAPVPAPDATAALPQPPTALCDASDCLPAFRASTIDGKTIQSDDLRGRPVVVMFWASWCEPCVTEGPSIEKVYQRHKGAGFELVGFSRDDAAVADIRKFRDHYHFSYPIVMATPEQFAAFGSPEHIPTFLLYGRDGKLALRMTGELSAAILERELQKLL